MIWLTDVKNKHKVAINPSNVVAVFTAPDGEFEGKTVISLVSGTLVVDETDLEVVSLVEGVN